MTRGEEPEQRLAEALRARATGAGRPAGQYVDEPLGTSARTALLLALLLGAVLGAAFALVSLLAPGVLPPLG